MLEFDTSATNEIIDRFKEEYVYARIIKPGDIKAGYTDALQTLIAADEESPAERSE